MSYYESEIRCAGVAAKIRRRDINRLLAELESLKQRRKELMERKKRRFHSKHPFRVWRDKRGMTLADAANAVGIPEGALADMENGVSALTAYGADKIMMLTGGQVKSMYCTEVWRVA